MAANSAGESSLAGIDPQRVLPRLLEQPTELVGEVLQWLDLKDLLNVRLTSKQLHNLVHDHETSICARFCRRLRLEHEALQLPAKIHGLENDLLFYIELHRRYHAILSLSWTLAQRVMTKLRIRGPKPPQEDIEQFRLRKTAKLQTRLFPALFLFNNYLEFFHATTIAGDEAFGSWDDDELLALHDVYDLDQQRIIEDFSPCNYHTIANVTAAFDIMTGICKASSFVLSTKAPKYPFATVKRILLCCGLVPFAKILEAGISDPDRRDLLRQSSEQLWQGRGRRSIVYNGPQLRSIRHLQIERIPLNSEWPNLAGTTARGYKTQNKFVEKQDLWYKAAFAVVQRQGGDDSLPINIDSWIKSVISEAADFMFDLGDWKQPNTT